MKLNRKNSKGFTIIELVIVIAVIGVLTAILIPTFMGITDKAHQTENETFVRNINTQLAINEASEGKKNPTMYEAVKDAQAMGFHVDEITPYNGNDIIWDSVNDKFAIVKQGYATATEADKASKIVYADGSFDVKTPLHKLWKCYVGMPGLSDQHYSIYAKKNWQDDWNVSDLKVGFDVGENAGFTSINYANTVEKEVIIRTNSFATTLTINGPEDTVKHYGNAAIVNVEKIKGLSYHENGTVGRLTIEEGHAVAEPEATIFCFNNNGATDATPSTVDVKKGATVYNNAGEAAGIDAVNVTNETFKDDCGAGEHDFGSQLVIDNKVYEVCKSCGYTLVHVVDEITGEDVLTVKTDSSNNIVNTPVETFNNNSETVNADGTVKADATPSVAAVDASELSSACLHEFGEPTVVNPTCYTVGSKTYTCTKCGETMTTAIAKVAHKYYDNPTDADSLSPNYHEKCLYHAFCNNDRGDANVAKIGDNEYRTLRQALASITDGTPTTVTMIADEAIYGNAGYTIAAGRNITIDLNGHKICNYITENNASNVFSINNGSLTIKDSTDTKKNGTGYGVIYNDYDRANEDVHVGEWWSTPQYNYATNVIKNSGTLTIESGKIYQTAAGSICYAVDNNSTSYNTTLNVNGGLLADAYGTVVRMFCNSTTAENTININGGSIVTSGYAAIWTQLPGSNAASHKKATLNIAGGTISGGTYAWYDYSYGDGWDNVNYSFSGGYFEGWLYSYALQHGKTEFITGGTFTKNPASYVDKNEYQVIWNAGVYTVIAND